jgi:uncharacterized membrane protein YbaN (DUF454 family)
MKQEKQEVNIIRNPVLRALMLGLGFLFMFLAVLGAILPVVPTTPFLLATAFFFFRSSARFYHWLMYNRLFGQYLQNYKSGKGIPLKIKLLALSFTWTSTLVSVIFFIPWLWLSVLVIGINIAVTVHLFRVKSR